MKSFAVFCLYENLIPFFMVTVKRKKKTISKDYPKHRPPNPKTFFCRAKKKNHCNSF